MHTNSINHKTFLNSCFTSISYFKKQIDQTISFLFSLFIRLFTHPTTPRQLTAKRITHIEPTNKQPQFPAIATPALPPPSPRYPTIQELFFDPTLSPDPVFVETIQQHTKTTNIKPPGIPNAGNTCFLASLTQAFLGGDDQILEAVQAAKISAKGKEKEALDILFDYLKHYRDCQKNHCLISIEKTQAMRKALHLLGLENALLPTQQDADETFVALFSVIAAANGRFSTHLWSFDTLGAPEGVSNAKLKKAHRVFDPERRIFLEPSQPHYGRLDLSIAKDKSFRSLIQDYFFEKTAKEMIRKADDRGIERSFPLQSKRLALETAPQKLCVVFKRFHSVNKIDRDILGIGDQLTFPKGEYFLDGKEAKYRLDGALFHHGKQMGSGHYTAVRRRIDPNGVHSFFLADDSILTPISQKEFIQRLPQAYMLFLTKI